MDDNIDEAHSVVSGGHCLWCWGNLACDMGDCLWCTCQLVWPANGDVHATLNSYVEWSENVFGLYDGDVPESMQYVGIYRR